MVRVLINQNIMKNFLSLVNGYLSNFWFTILIFITGSYLVIFYDPSFPLAIIFGRNGEFGSLSLVLWRFWMMLFLPLGIISILVSGTIWLKDKTGDSYRGFIALIIILLSLGLSFMLVSKLNILDQDIRSHTGIFSTIAI